MSQNVNCYLCGNKVPSVEAVRYNDKRFHEKCYQEYIDREQLCNYICKIYHLKAPGPKNYGMIKRYRAQGMTYLGMLNALKYFYEVKGKDIARAEERIGIVPYVYEEGNNYYKKLKQTTAKLDNAYKEKNKTIKTVITKKERKPRKEKVGYDMSSLWGEE